MIFTRDDLCNSFPAEWVARAEQLHSTVKPNIQCEGEIISSLVSVANAKPQRVYIRTTSSTDNTISFLGECSCNVRRNCEHVLVVLLAALASEGSNTPTPQSVCSSTSAAHSATGVQLLFVLQNITSPAIIRQIEINLFTARALQSGGFGRTTPFRLTATTLRRPPAFLGNKERELLANLLPGATTSTLSTLDQEATADALHHIFSSGRCFINDPIGAPLAAGEPRKATSYWQLDDHGNQSFALHCEPAASSVILTTTPYYLDTEKQTAGLLETSFSTTELRTLIDLPTISPEHAEATQTQLQQQFFDTPLPELTPLTLETQPQTVPTPQLHLSRGDKSERLQAEFSFDYSGITVQLSSGTRIRRGARIIKLQRNKELEQQHHQALERAGFSEDFSTLQWRYRGPSTTEKEQHFLLLELPQLQSNGWHIETAPSLGIAIITDIDEWYGELTPEHDNDWFTLDLGVIIDGEHIALLPALTDLISTLPDVISREGLARLSDNACIHVPLDDGRLIPLPVKKLRRILTTLIELCEPGSLNKKGGLVMSRWQAANLAELELDQDEAWQWCGETELRELAERLRNVDTIRVAATPQGLQATLRPYQQRGLDWLQFLREYGLAGILADDMGLGKTLQTLAHILLEKEQGRLHSPCLIVAPTSLLSNWHNEAKRFTPDLKALILHGTQRGEHFHDITRHDLIITSYGLLLRDETIHTLHNYHLLVLDEAQMIKNASAKVSQVVRRLPAKNKLCLSGTPMENHLGELWSLFDFLMPGFLGKQAQFQRLFRKPIEKEGNEERSEALAQRLQPYLLRRKKSRVIAELPPCTEILLAVSLQGKQRELYEGVRLSMQKLVRDAVAENGLARSNITVLSALLKLRQTCCDPRLVKLEAAANIEESAKLELLMGLLPEMIEEGRRILLFSQFTSMLKLIQMELDKAGIDFVTLTGQTQNRPAVIDTFQSGAVPIFLISLKAGGTGLNLTSADTIIHYDPWWNPAVENQATARAHRIGQNNPVFVYKLLTEGTVEEKIQQMQQRKQTLANTLYNGKANAEPQWSAEDLDNLFQPL